MGRSVLFVTTSFPSSRDQARGAHIRTLARAVQAQGWRVTVLAPGSPDAAAVTEVDGLTVRRHSYWARRHQQLASGLSGIMPNLRSHPSLGVQLPGLVLSQCVAARRYAGDHDLVHAHWVVPSGLSALVARRKINVPVIMTSHGGDVNIAKPGSLYGWLVGRVASSADICTAVSEDLSIRLEALGVPSSRIELTPLGVDVPERAPGWPPGEGGVRFVYVGSLIRRKSVSTLVAAFALLRESGRLASLLVVGDGPDRSRLERQALRLGVAVRFAGACAHQETQRLVASSHIMVLPSESEGRPLVVLEAMALSRPVITSNIPGTREVVIDRVTGLMFPQGDVQGLTDQMVFAVDHLEEMRLMGEAARSELAKLGLTTEQSGRRLAELYERVLGSRSSDSMA